MPVPAVSVIVPCFNLGEYLDETLESIQRQTCQDFEIVVVDDGSTDPFTRKRLDAVAAHPDIRVITGPNRGLSAARNRGVEYSSAPVVCCLDADDLLEPEWLARGLELLEAEPDLAFVSHWMEAFGDEQWPWTPGRCDLLQLLDVNCLNSAALVRRSVFARVGGFDETMRDGCEDWEFWIRVASAGLRGTIVPEVHYRYRRRPDSMSRRMSESDLRFDLYNGLIARNPEAFDEFLPDLILRREHSFARQISHVHALWRDLVLVTSALDERRRELAAAHDRLSRQRVRARAEKDMRARTDGAERRVADLEGSLSWKITAPLRRAAAWLGWLGGRRSR